MARYCGRIGFVKLVESPEGSGIWREQATERRYKGNFVKKSVFMANRSAVADDLNMSNQLSIIGDSYATCNIGYIRYAEVDGTLWRVEEVEVNRPRLTLFLGGVYNGQQA